MDLNYINSLNNKIMPNEGAPSVNNIELNSNTVESSVVETKSGLDSGPIVTPELSPEEQRKNIGTAIETNQQGADRLNKSVEGDKTRLNEIREKLGLPPTEEDPQSVLHNKKRLEELQDERSALEKQKEKLISQQEKEKLIKEEKEKILQRKLDALFREFKALSSNDLESISRDGTLMGQNFESKSVGSLSPETAQFLARAFKEGIKLLSKILETEPNFLKKFDEKITEEATENVDKKLEEGKQKMEEDKAKEEKPEELKSEENPETPKVEIPANETTPESSSSPNL